MLAPIAVMGVVQFGLKKYLDLVQFLKHAGVVTTRVFDSALAMIPILTYTQYGPIKNNPI